MMSNFIKNNFQEFQLNKCKILFSKKSIDFKIDNEVFNLNIEKLKEELKVDDIGFLRQIHSDTILDYNGEIAEGDSIVTDKKNIALAVFTADCVPILLWDQENDVIAAVHSGWKGTKKNILGKTIDKMIKDYNCKAANIFSFIGPHIQRCCYEVSEELIDKFKNQEVYKGISINEVRNLDLNLCILTLLREKGILENNIHNTKLCTCCNKENNFHSYRKDKETAGRIISIIYIGGFYESR